MYDNLFQYSILHRITLQCAINCIDYHKILWYSIFQLLSNTSICYYILQQRPKVTIRFQSMRIQQTKRNLTVVRIGSARIARMIVAILTVIITT